MITEVHMNAEDCSVDEEEDRGRWLKFSRHDDDIVELEILNDDDSRCYQGLLNITFSDLKKLILKLEHEDDK